MADLDARFRAKMAARASKTTPVFEDEPVLAVGDDQAAIDARFAAKLARHNGKAALSAAATPPADSAKTDAKQESKPEVAGKKGGGQQAQLPAEPKADAKQESGDSRR